MSQTLSLETAVRRRFLMVRAGSRTYAIPVSRVKRVLRSGKTYPVPGSRKAFRGLLQYEGEPVVTLELRVLVDPGGDSEAELPFAIIVSAGPPGEEEQVALAVDDALTIGWISTAAMSIVNDGIIEGETVIDGHIVRVLDLNAIGTEA